MSQPPPARLSSRQRDQGGQFISFEGGEGAGKSTQIRVLLARLTAAGIQAIATREPGGAPEAEFLRGVLLGAAHDFAPQTEMLLHFAARAEHLARTIRPALERGAWVLCDRFFDSTEAYQGFGQGADRKHIATLKTLIDPQPALTLVLDVSERVAAARQVARGRAEDRYDALGPAFHARVAEGFRRIAADNPTRCALINADASEDAVAADILQIVLARFPPLLARFPSIQARLP
jgi:dTMP kinase